MIEVVSAVIIRNDRILLTQRRIDQDFPMTWECPGGKVEGNESHHQALRRELREELDVDVGDLPNTALWSGRFDSPVSRPDRASIFLLFYVVPEFTGTPTPREGQGLGWFRSQEMLSLRLAPANERAVAHVLDQMRRRIAGEVSP